MKSKKSVDPPQAGAHGPAVDAAEQLRRWDAGDSIWTVEMGGLGPGYEQA